MHRKTGLLLTAALVLGALALAVPAHASMDRVRGKFVPSQSGAPVLGSAKVRPLPGAPNVWRTLLTLQHVRRSDYTLFIGRFTDANGDQKPQASELDLVPVASCDLTSPTKKGHEGCGRADATYPGMPNIAVLRVPAGTGPDAYALLH
jgi:hypothetical protein